MWWLNDCTDSFISWCDVVAAVICGVSGQSPLETVGRNAALFGVTQGPTLSPLSFFLGSLRQFPVCCLSQGTLHRVCACLCVCMFVCMFPLSCCFIWLCLHRAGVSCPSKARGCLVWLSPSTECPTSCSPLLRVWECVCLIATPASLSWWPLTWNMKTDTRCKCLNTVSDVDDGACQ